MSVTNIAAVPRGAPRELIACRALRVGHAGRALLPPIDVSIRSGELWAVIGRNGSGKTTWLRTLLGLTAPLGGELTRAATDLRVAYLPQRRSVDERYPLLAAEVVELGMLRRWSFLRGSRGRRATILEALREMDVADLAQRPFRELSEGQQQRVLFARIAAAGAELAILDEPTSAMDLVAEREAYGLLAELRRRHGLAILVVSHYLGLAKEFADRAILLDRETPAVVVGTPREVFRHESFLARYGDTDRPRPLEQP